MFGKAMGNRVVVILVAALVFFAIVMAGRASAVVRYGGGAGGAGIAAGSLGGNGGLAKAAGAAGIVGVGYAIAHGVTRGHTVAHHPGRYPGLLRKMREDRGRGRLFIKHHNSWGKIARFLKQRVGFRRLKNKFPQAAFACATMAVVSFALNGHPRDALNACVGAAVGVFISRGKLKMLTTQYAGGP